MRRLAVLGSILLLMLTSCTMAGHQAAGRPASSGSSSADSPNVRTVIYGSLSVRHPASWRLVAVEMRAAGPGGAVAFLTNQPAAAQCSTVSANTADPHGAYNVTCQSPVTALHPHGVIIDFSTDLGMRPVLTTHNRILDGHLATVQQMTPAAVYCPTGATNALQMSVFVPHPQAIPAGSGETVTMSACYAGPSAASITQQINALIDSVTFA
jgi:hypothetical protein